MIVVGLGSGYESLDKSRPWSALESVIIDCSEVHLSEFDVLQMRIFYNLFMVLDSRFAAFNYSSWVSYEHVTALDI